jgi:hypothetical protein
MVTFILNGMAFTGSEVKLEVFNEWLKNERCEYQIACDICKDRKVMKDRGKERMERSE